MCPRTSLTVGPVFGLVIALLASPPARSAEVAGYGIESAAKEITQLYWLAATAQVCGWASASESSRFKAFSLRFLGAHLSDRARAALLTIVNQPGYDVQLHQAAIEGASSSCGNARWRQGWDSYNAAAHERESEY